MSSIPQATVLYPQQQQPTPASPHSQSNGSYGPVFAVLAVIAVLAVSACIIGRLCARRIRRPSAEASRGGPYKGDIESRSTPSIPTGKPIKANKIEAVKYAESRGRAKQESHSIAGRNLGAKSVVF